jgi:hypothetical protein
MPHAEDEKGSVVTLDDPADKCTGRRRVLHKLLHGGTEFFSVIVPERDGLANGSISSHGVVVLVGDILSEAMDTAGVRRADAAEGC